MPIKLPPAPKEDTAVYSYKYKNNGNPTVKGTSFIVLTIVEQLKHMLNGLEDQGYIEDLKFEELVEVLKFCSERKCDTWEKHCGGCSLSYIQDGILTVDDFVNRFEDVRFTHSDIKILGKGKEQGTIVVQGKLQNLLENWNGIDGWKTATRLLSFENIKAIKALVES